MEVKKIFLKLKTYQQVYMLMRMTEKEKLTMQERGDDYSISLSRQKWEQAQRMGSSTLMKETALNKSGTTYMIYFLFYRLSQH